MQFLSLAFFAKTNSRRLEHGVRVSSLFDTTGRPLGVGQSDGDAWELFSVFYLKLVKRKEGDQNSTTSSPPLIPATAEEKQPPFPRQKAVRFKKHRTQGTSELTIC